MFFLKCLYPILLCLLQVNIPFVNHSELGLSLILFFLIGRYSSINVLSVFMNALYEASGLYSLYISSQFVHFNFILSFAKFFHFYFVCRVFCILV